LDSLLKKHIPEKAYLKDYMVFGTAYILIATLKHTAIVEDKHSHAFAAINWPSRRW